MTTTKIHSLSVKIHKLGEAVSILDNKETKEKVYEELLQAEHERAELLSNFNEDRLSKSECEVQGG